MTSPSRAVLLRHPIAIVGAVLTTVSAVVFIALLIAELLGLFHNPYAGIVIFVGLPVLFVLGLLLMPFGMWLEQRRLAAHPDAPRDWFVFDFGLARTRRWALVIIAMSAVNLVILLLAGYGSLHYMESPSFCGQVCHEPMHPQFAAWQNAPHSNVECAQCHVGEGGRAFLHYKVNGTRQLYHVITNQIPRPIPGVADMRPAQEVCGTCHWSGKGFGDAIRVKREYADDEANTETKTILQVHIGGPGSATLSGRAIHWHANPNVHIEFVAADPERQTILYVKVTDARGGVREFTADGAKPEDIAKGERRVMDCMDCHNVPAHRIAASAEEAVDRAIAAGQIDRGLPFIRREGVRVLKADYASTEEGLKTIAVELQKFYASRGKPVDGPLSNAITALNAIYSRNVFPSMKVKFGTYPDNLGHIAFPGCNRCHDGSHNAKDATSINSDCEYCHKQIEEPPPSSS